MAATKLMAASAIIVKICIKHRFVALCVKLKWRNQYEKLCIDSLWHENA